MPETENEGVHYHFLTNMHNRDKELVTKAIELSGFKEILCIRNVSYVYVNTQSILKNHFGLYTSEGCLNHSKFWRMLDELKETREKL